MDPMAKAFATSFERSSKFVSYFTAGLEGEDWYARPAGTPNPAIWTLGHLAFHRGLFLELLSGERTYPESWRALFGMGCQPLADPHGYPDVATCLRYLKETHDALNAYLETASEAELETPPLQPSRFLALKADVLAHLVVHEAHHTGNVAVLRRLLGKEKVI
jgi:uncharacterized damage-inducible protein DinB